MLRIFPVFPRLEPIRPGLFEGGSACGDGRGGGDPAAYYSKTINDIGVKFCGLADNHTELINLVWFKRL